MGNKIFISYKYGDTSVKRLPRTSRNELTKVRDYVDELQDRLGNTDHLNKGELDGEDMSQFKDSTIESKLRQKIYDSSVTVVLLSPNMFDHSLLEDDQWIPWEISYSLKVETVNNRHSNMNALLGVVIPDTFGSYDYIMRENHCWPNCRCTTFDLSNTFEIIQNNTFNRKKQEQADCNSNRTVFKWPYSYIQIVKWDDFVSNIDGYIATANAIRDRADEFEIQKLVKK